MRASSLMWAALTIAVGVALFLVKYKVQDLERQLTAKQTQITHDESEIRVLQAEWTYLNDPDRLRRLSAEFLGLHPATPANVATIANLPQRDASETDAGAAPASAPPAADTAAATTTPTQVSAEMRPPQRNTSFAEPATPERPSMLSVAFARLQRLLLPTAAGATTPFEAGK